MATGVVFLGVIIVVLLIIAVLAMTVGNGGRTVDPRTPPPGSPQAYRTTPTPLPPVADETYRDPASVEAKEDGIVEAEAVEIEKNDAGTRVVQRNRPPRRVVNCPRCQQAILNEEKLAERRVACPVCACKFFLPRDV